MRALLDTHIVLDYLKGLPAAQAELASYSELMISAISVTELYLAASEDQQPALAEFLRLFRVVPLDSDIARAAATIKREHRPMKLPHAALLASARASGSLLLTRNAMAYPASTIEIRVPY